MPDGTQYSERLTVPLRWWVQATMLLATLWLAFAVALPLWAASAAAGGLLLVCYAFFAWIGFVRIAVEDGVLHAGTAHIGLEHLGSCEPLGPEDTRRVLGRDADARAFLVTRPYLKRAVRVAVADPSDPTPYWMLSTRRPDRLAAALTRSWSGDTP